MHAQSFTIYRLTMRSGTECAGSRRIVYERIG